MGKKIFKNIVCAVFMSVLLLSFIVATPISLAQTGSGQGADLWNDEFHDTTVQDLQEIGLGNKDPREIATNIIKILLGLLGIIAVVIILVGGFKWMTAMGNDDKVAEAKKLLGAGVIGLLVVLAAWALAMFIIGRFLYVTGSEFDENIYKQ